MGLIARAKHALFAITRFVARKHASRRSPDETRSQLRNGAYSLTAIQVRQLIEIQDNLRDRVLVRLLAETGLRRAEAANLELGDIDYEHQTIIVRKGKGRS